MLWEIVAKTVAVQTVTYFIVGLVAFRLFNYADALGEPAASLRPASDPRVRAGVLFQPLRGLLFAVVFFLLRDVLFTQPSGWLVMWVMLVFVGILSTFAPASASIEGFIYIKPGATRTWGGLAEILSQSLLLSTITFYWVNHPEAIWLTWLLVIFFAAALALPALGLIAGHLGPAKHGPTPKAPTAA